jgi:hypothetical protein
MDKGLDQDLFIDFKTERAKPALGRPRPASPAQGEPDWNNRAKQRFQTLVPGTPDEHRAKIVTLLKNCLARLEGSEPRRAWEPRAQSYPYTSMGLALLEAIRLLDVIAEKLQQEPITPPEGGPE